MASLDIYIWDETSDVFYAKPKPVAGGTWSSDIVLGVRTGSEVKFTINDQLPDGYWIFQRVGGSPASTDTQVYDVPGPDQLTPSPNIYIWGEPAKTYYAKPRPLVTSPWSSGILAGVRNGSTNEIKFVTSSAVTGGYWVFEQLGGSPASSDLLLYELPAQVSSLVTLQSALDSVTAQLTRIENQSSQEAL